MTADVHRHELRTAGGRTRRLTVAGGLAFWLTNLMISLTPIAADYRSALSIGYVPMLLEAFVGGLLLAFGVTTCLLRFPDALPGRTPLLKSGVVSLVALALVTLLLEVPAKFLTPTPHALRYFLIGLAFNVLRIAALGAVVGSWAGHRDPARGA